MRPRTLVAGILLLAPVAIAQGPELTGEDVALLEALREYPKSTLLAICEISKYPAELRRLESDPDSYRGMTAQQVNDLAAGTSPETILAIEELLQAPEAVAVLASRPLLTRMLGQLYSRHPELVVAWIDRAVAARNLAEYGMETPEENPAMEDEVAQVYESQGTNEGWAEPIYANGEAVEYVLRTFYQYPNTVAFLLQYAETVYSDDVAAWVQAMEDLYGLYYEVGESCLFVEELLLETLTELPSDWTQAYETFEYVLDHCEEYPYTVAEIAEMLSGTETPAEARAYVDRYRQSHPGFEPSSLLVKPPTKSAAVGPGAERKAPNRHDGKTPSADRMSHWKGQPRPGGAGSQPKPSSHSLYQSPSPRPSGYSTNPFQSAPKKPPQAKKSARIQSGSASHGKSWSGGSPGGRPGGGRR